MHVRVVRFTDVDEQRMQETVQRIKESEGPPPGVPSKAITLAYDAEGRTAVVLQYYESKEDLEAGARVLEQMDASDTPGTRASVDACEIKVELSAP